MTYKRIMVPLNGLDDPRHALAIAFDLGRRFEGEVVGMHAEVDTASSLPYMGESMSGALVETMIANMDNATGQRRNIAKAAFEAAQQAAGSEGKAGMGSFVVYQGQEDDLLAWHGRLADLVVVGRPEDASALNESPTIHAAIMETGRPVLVAPPGETKTLGRNIMIAWNGSPQAVRAIAAALPLLQEAEAITLLSIEEGGIDGPPAAEAVDYLAAHGCQAQAVALSKGHGTVGDTLLLAAHNEGADLMVMGAYTHNRIRQFIFGGATLEALLDATIPVLMAH
ncbi:MAG: universal stress protein [Rhodospirillaceae bacterium]|jgi:nucleotide-binding universal stress UspA family protein|nr:universal stress protein [Rhodospirillaceae bacterium]MBT4042827.1 universal stress protein [Rhodospirillaceae bacterium]MBT4689227.1 universal stress protein [Rhodospirillaceae bacterium]MBT5080446.1 universal stress protein [Rhodospirillaceae bacterium]MBT5523226.1 universal stress protein [Rhodospirillaceae bacterium]